MSALKQQKQEAAAALVAASDLPAGGAWIAEARKDALARLKQMGLPSRRDEYWKFTRPDSLLAPLEEALLFKTKESPVFSEIDRLQLVFVDGVLDLDQSDDLSAENLEIETLQAAGDKDIHWAKSLYGVLETRGQTPVERPLATLNTALAGEGVLIRATGPIARPICLTYRRGETGVDAMVHHVIRVEKDASLTLLEHGPAADRFSQVMEIDVADQATFHHVRTQGRDHERRGVAHLFARTGTGSTLKSFTLTANGRLTRNEYVVDILGDEAHVTVSGAAVGDGDFHQDDTVFITHDAVNCESRQVFKKVLRNGATGVFQGKILVKAGAQKTDGYQISQGLMLDDESQFLAKPELEIYADDVACSHGSTVGAIDETALFYLTSRGIPRTEAQDMLVLAFLAEALEEISDETLRAEVFSRLEGWIERHSA